MNQLDGGNAQSMEKDVYIVKLIMIAANCFYNLNVMFKKVHV